MWKLKTPTDQDLDDYYNTYIKKDVENRLNAYQKYKSVLNGIDAVTGLPYVVILVKGDPKTLERLVPVVMKSFIPTYSQKELENYKDNLKGHTQLSASDTLLRDEYDNVFKDLKAIFDYESFISRKPVVSYWLTEKKGANTCTYCNRQYTPTISKFLRTGSRGKQYYEYITHPTLDHWFSHEMYPLLGLSYYNLIPSCSVCNSGAKGSKLFSLQDYVHPHMSRNDNPDFTFRAAGGGGHWLLTIDHDKKSPVHNTLDAFKLEEIYAFHQDWEVKDIMDFSEITGGNYLKDLYDIVLSDTLGAKSSCDAYQMLFGAMSDPKDFLKRPFSKLKYDLLKQLGVI